MKITIELSREAAIDLLRQLERELRADDPPMPVKVGQQAAWLALYVEDFPWPTVPIQKTRLRTAFRYAAKDDNSFTIEDLCRAKKREIEYLRNLGPKSLKYLKEALAEKGLKLGMTDAEIEAYRAS